MSTRDYTDSEPESDTPAPVSPTRSPKSRKGAGTLKITLRNTSHTAESSKRRQPSSSPPPPIKLKLGMKHAARSYSSDDEPEFVEHPSPPAKRQKTGKGKDKEKSRERDRDRDRERDGDQREHKEKSGSRGPTLPAAHRKAYNWLQPSAAGASHHGPPDRPERVDRERRYSAASSSSLVHVDTDDAASDKEGGKKKKKRESAPGPGKNWRKGMKKGDPIPWKDGATFLGDSRTHRSSPLATPQQRASASREPTPEFDALILEAATAAPSRSERPERPDRSERPERPERPERAEREPSPVTPFVLANAATLGIPIFANPIVAPKLNLGTFPKVTSFFAPFDQKPFRKEHVRTWKCDEKNIVGVGGGTLKFKTWQRGPPSELGRILQAQREADALLAKKKKEGKADSEAPDRTPDRPSLPHSVSTDSVPQLGDDGAATNGNGNGSGNASGNGSGMASGVASGRASAPPDDASEAGDDESNAGSPAPSPAPRGRGSKRGRPRKSKLANEIIVDELEDDKV